MVLVRIEMDANEMTVLRDDRAKRDPPTERDGFALGLILDLIIVGDDLEARHEIPLVAKVKHHGLAVEHCHSRDLHDVGVNLTLGNFHEALHLSVVEREDDFILAFRLKQTLLLQLLNHSFVKGSELHLDGNFGVLVVFRLFGLAETDGQQQGRESQKIHAANAHTFLPPFRWSQPILTTGPIYPRAVSSYSDFPNFDNGARRWVAW